MSSFTSSSFTSSSNTSSSKKIKLHATHTQSSLTIGTHSGTFQADEATGVWLLRQLPQYYNSPVVRSRDLEVLKDLDIVIDVGGVYDHALRRYDHHQRDFDAKFPKSDVTKLSAAGLVYLHYGKSVITEFYPWLNNDAEKLDLVYNKLYDSFMLPLDAIDNGVEVADSVRYRDSTGISARVGKLNKRWNDSGDGETDDERFSKASAMCGNEFLSQLEYIVESDLEAYNFVDAAVQNRYTVDPSGEIIKFESGGMPWKGHLYDLEAKYNIEGVIKFVLYQDQSGMWRIQAVTVKGTAFTNRIGLCKAWRGVRDADLVKAGAPEGSKFAHASGFIGGAGSLECALGMAKLSIAEGEP
jgi:uncharacterized UPF0160 family protein